MNVLLFKVIRCVGTLKFVAFTCLNSFGQQDLIKRADDAIKARRYYDAITYCTNANAQNPKNIQAYNLWGNALLNLGRYSNAIEKFNSALAIDSTNKFTWRDRGYCFEKLKNEEKALQDYQRALTIDPSYTVALNDIGLLYKSRGQSSYPAAIKYFSAAIKSDLKFKYAYYNRGNINYNSELYDDALRDFKYAVNIDSNYVDALEELSETYIAIHHYDEAIPILNRILKLNPDDDYSLENRGFCFEMMQKYDKALLDYNAAIAINPDYSNAYRGRGTVYYRTSFNNPKNLDLAFADFTKCIAKSSIDLYALYSRGVIHYIQKNYKGAEKDFNDVIEIDSNYREVFFRRGQSLFEQQRYELAISDFTKSLATNRANEEDANYYLGQCFMSIKEYDKSIEFYNRAIKINRRNIDALYDLGFSYLCKRNFDKAIEQFNATLAISPSDKSARNGKGLAYYYSGLYAESIKELDMAIKIDSNFADAYINATLTCLANNEFLKAEDYYEIYKERKLTSYIDSDSWQFIRTYIQTCLYQIKQKKYNLASQTLKKSVDEFELLRQENPFHFPISALFLGNVYAKQGYVQEKLGNQSEADSFFTKALAINPAIGEAKPGYVSIKTFYEDDIAPLNSAKQKPSDLSTIPVLEPVNAKANFYALLIAEQNYDGNEFAKLKRPVEDATALKNVLISKYNFSAQNVTVKTNENRNNLISAMKQFLQGKSDNDNLLIFFAGHGTYEKDSRGEPIEGYWVPLEAKKRETHNFISASEIRVELQKTLAKHVLVISDACFSGTLLRGSVMEDATPDVKAFYEKPSRQLLASGNLEPVPDSSPFVYYLLEELQNNKDKYITVTELWLRITKLMRNSSGPSPICEQFRDMTREPGQFIFAKAK